MSLVGQEPCGKAKLVAAYRADQHVLAVPSQSSKLVGLETRCELDGALQLLALRQGEPTM